MQSSAGSYQNKQRCILLLDTSIRMDDKTMLSFQHSITSFFEQVAQHPALSQNLEIGIVTFGTGGQIRLWPQSVVGIQAPWMLASGSSGPESGLPAALSLLRSAPEETTAWLVTVCGDLDRRNVCLSEQITNLEWAISLASYQTLTIQLGEHTPAFVPPGEQAVRLRDHRFQQFFDWLIEALDFYGECQDDLPFTTAYSWAELNFLPE